MDHWLDSLSKALARGLSRRDALRLFGGAAAAAATGFPARALAQGNSDCAHFCNDAFPPGSDRGDCKSDAAHGTGPCYTCGPAAPTGHPNVCGVGTSAAVCCPSTAPTCCGNTTCTNLQTDVANCGACGNACATGQGCCSGACTPLNTVQNCGTCGVVCTAPANATANCATGTCAFVCNAGFVLCQGQCVPTCPDGEVLNPATCTCACPTGTTLCNGTCVSTTCPTGQVFNPNTCTCQPSPHPECIGTTCGSLKTCSTSNPDCLCFTTSTGAGFCVPGSTSCASVNPCGPAPGFSCPSGFVCATSTCCATPVCAPISLTQLCPLPTSGSSAPVVTPLQASVTSGPTFGHP